MTANIDADIRAIQQASRGEEVRDAIVNALVAINDGEGSATQQIVNQLINEKIDTLDAASTGGAGKYIKSISEANGVIAASEESADTSPTKNSQKLITSDGVATAIEELQTNFQDGVDDIYDAVVAKGTTPASKSLSDVIDGINNIQSGDLDSVIRRSYESKSVAVKSHAVDDLFFYLNVLCKAKTSIAIGDNLVENTNYETTTVVDVMNTKLFTTTSVHDITKINAISNTGAWVNKTWNGLSDFNGDRVWTDGTDIYYSSGEVQKVLDKDTSTWSDKTWNGRTDFIGSYVWTDGTNIYCRTFDGIDGNYIQSDYILNKSTSTWSIKQWNWSPSTLADNLFVDTKDIVNIGDNVYAIEWDYSLDEDLSMALDKSTSTWSEMTSPFGTDTPGKCVWTDGDNYYASWGSSYQKLINPETLAVSDVQWNGYTDLNSQYIWSDGTNIYYSEEIYQKVLDKATSTWNNKTWSGITYSGVINFSAEYVWSDGTHIYYSNGNRQYVLT